MIVQDTIRDEQTEVEFRKSPLVAVVKGIEGLGNFIARACAALRVQHNFVHKISVGYY